MVFFVSLRKLAAVIVIQLLVVISFAQPGVPVTKWSPDGNDGITDAMVCVDTNHG